VTRVSHAGATDDIAAGQVNHYGGRKCVGVSTSTNRAYSAIATGLFTDGGSAILQANQGTLPLQKGTIKVTTKPGKSSQSVNPKTCLGVATQPGTYKLVSGTGAYKGITGSGK
jgi:hypothetical protein